MTTNWQEIISRLYPGVPEKFIDPYPLYATLREQAPVFQQADGKGTWHLTRYNDVAAALRDPRLSSHRPSNEFQGDPEQMTEEERKRVAFFLRNFRLLLLFQDPPVHTRLRSLVSKAFTPRMVELLRPRIQQLVDDFLSPYLSLGEMDLVSALAVPLPLTVIMELLGIPITDRAQFKSWSDALFLGGPGSERAFIARTELSGYLRDLIAVRQANPQDDLISAFVTARIEGSALTEDEVIAQCQGILIAGHETTTALIANGMLALLSHLQAWRMLNEHPELYEPAVEELLRYDSPFQHTGRTAQEDLFIDGQHIRVGERVILWLGAANRDPARFPNPDTLDLARQDNRHLAFGAGVHYCLGAALARLEGQIVFNTLAQRLKNIRTTATTFVRYTGNPSLRTVQSLPIAFTPVA